MRSKRTLATIYVPDSVPVGTPINITILDGCDNTSNDRGSAFAATDYYMLNSPSNNPDSQTNCDGAGNVDFTFFTTPIVDALHDKQGIYNAFYFISNATDFTGRDGHYYYNFYRLQANTPGVFIGASLDKVVDCNSSSFPEPGYANSCPTSGYVYSSFGQTNIAGQAFGGNYSEQATVPPDCEFDMWGQVDLYDLDAGIYGQNNIRANFTDTDPTGNTTYVNYQGSILLQNFPLNGYPNTGNDQEATLPPTTILLQKGHTYRMWITGLTRTNTLQIRLIYSRNPDGSGGSNCHSVGHQPIGVVDGATCKSVDGWALDLDAPANPVRVDAYVDGSNGIYSGPTTINRSDVNNAVTNNPGYGASGITVTGNHGFSIPIPSQFQTGSHTVTVYMFGLDSNGNQDAGPFTIGTASFDASLCPPPMVTIRGSVYDAQDSSKKYANIFVYTCVAGVSATTDGAGNYSFDIPRGSQFCVGTNDLPGYTDAVHPRPTGGWGYLSCAEFPPASVNPSGRTPNYCTADWRFNNQVAGQNVGGFDRGVDGGFDLVYTRPAVTVQGTIYNAYNLGQKYNNVGVWTCSSASYIPARVYSNAAGVFSVTMYRGDTFCLYPDTNQPSPTYNNRPYAEGYNGCAAYNNSVSNPPGYSYCPTGNYDWQVAGGAYPFGPNIDRTSDTGFDFVFRFPPQVNCTVSGPATAEANVPFSVKFYGIDNSDSIHPVVTNGIFTYTISGVGSNSGAYNGGLNPRGNPGRLLANDTYSAGRGTYPINNANITAVGDGIPAGPVTCTGSTSITLADYPYIKTYGADVVTGSGFSTTGPSPTCQATPGTISAYAQKDPLSAGYKGSAAQNAAIARGNIMGFFTAGNRDVADVPPDNLTFSNTNGTEYGGGYGTVPCITDYFSDPSAVPAPVNGGTRAPSVAQTPWTGTIAAGIGKHRYTASGNINLNNLSLPLNVPAGSQVAIYVEGNVEITNDIIFASAGSVDQLPNLALIVHGNIYIAPGVKRIDGLYVAQPHTGQEAVQGRIYTCAGFFGPVAAVNLATTCGSTSTPLAINGALIAQEIRFMRTQNSLRNSTYSNAPTAGEVPNFADGSGTGAGANTKAAEVINFTPEIYIAPSALHDPDLSCATASCKYDSIYSLPPVY